MEKSAYPSPNCYHFTSKYTMQNYPFHLIIPPTNTTSYMTSYFPRSVREWAKFTATIPLIEVKSLATFPTKSQNICYYIYCNLFNFVTVGLISNCCLPFPSKIIINTGSYPLNCVRYIDKNNLIRGELDTSAYFFPCRYRTDDLILISFC